VEKIRKTEIFNLFKLQSLWKSVYLQPRDLMGFPGSKKYGEKENPCIARSALKLERSEITILETAKSLHMRANPFSSQKFQKKGLLPIVFCSPIL